MGLVQEQVARTCFARSAALRPCARRGGGVEPVAQTAGFAVCGSSLTRATRWDGVAPAREETRTTRTVVRATCWRA